MAEVFAGIRTEEQLADTGEARLEDPCLAVSLAALGVADKEACHRALVAQGISNEAGESDLSDGDVDIQIGDSFVAFGPGVMSWDFDSLADEAKFQFQQGRGIIVAVKLREDDESDHDMHFIMLAGHYDQDGTITDVVVSDSLPGAQNGRIPAAEVAGRLLRTLEWSGALFSNYVEITTT